MCSSLTAVPVDILDTNLTIEASSHVRCLLIQKYHTNIFQPETALLFFESSSNPNNKVPDFENIISEVKKRNPNCLIVVDNTFLR